MYDIVSKICLPGQHILDPFCGAGTTGIAALKNGCLFDGLELDIENVNISKGRLNNATKKSGFGALEAFQENMMDAIRPFTDIELSANLQIV